MRRVVLGLCLCTVALIALHFQQTIIGLLFFVYGTILMYGGKWPRGPR